MGTINKLMLTLTASAALYLPALAQSEKVHVKVVKVIDGDSTVIEKDIDENELPAIEKELADVKGKNVKVMLHVEKGDAGKMKNGDHFFVFSDSMPNCKMVRKEMIIGADTMVIMRPEREELIDLELSRDEMMNGFSFDIDNTDGKERVVVRTMRPDSTGKMVIKKFEGKPGDHFEDEDVIVHSKDGKTVRKVIVTTRVKVEEDATKGENKSSKKEKSELKLKDLKFYPNPSDGKFSIEFESDGKLPVTIIITDMSGKQVQKQEVKGEGRHNLWFDLSSEGKGTYILNLQQGKKSTTKKIVIE